MRTLLVTTLAVLALLGAACGGGDGGDEAALETAVDTAPVGTGTGGETVPEVTTCSVTDQGVTLTDEELPPPVAEVRERIFAAASECDFDLLQEIALEKGERFTYGRNERGPMPARYWRNLEVQSLGDPMYVLAVLLTLPSTQNPSGAHIWPSAAKAQPTEADWQALTDSFLLAPDEVRQMQEDGRGYTGPRTSITADGDWLLFTEGTTE
jgi:hypothetical protein